LRENGFERKKIVERKSFEFEEEENSRKITMNSLN